MTQRRELRALTGLRGIAAWWVVLYHVRLSIAGLPDGLGAVFARGYLAVDVFFLLSGFVIWLSWHERLHRPSAGAIAWFWRKRIARIWPLHLVMLAAAMLLAGVLGATGHSDRLQFPPGELPFHLLLVQSWGSTERLSWNQPAWSISVEWAAYLLFPLLATVADWRRLPSLALLAIAALILLALHASLDGAPTLGSDITRNGVRRCLAEFATGSIVAALWLRCCGRRWLAWPAGMACAALLAAWAIGVPETLTLPAAFAALLLALALTSGLPGNPLESRPIHHLGRVSYATYLGHFLLWKVFKLAFVTDPGAVPLGQIAAYLTIVLVSSVVLYHLVERPAQRLLERLGTRQAASGRPDAAPALR